MDSFVKQGSIVRKIWGRSDIILFIFAGASAEFALNKAVDWLYFTGKLPSDPLGRLFSTVSYARDIVFSSRQQAHDTIDRIRDIHRSVEKARGGSIPDWAYRDVLFMLIYYSIAAYELLEKPLGPHEKAGVYDVFSRVGHRMGLKELPVGYSEWLRARDLHLLGDLDRSRYSLDLFAQYRKHLGLMRYKMLIEGQKLVIPPRVHSLLGFRPLRWMYPMVPAYRLSRKIKLDGMIKNILLPSAYKEQIKALDFVNNYLNNY